MRCHGHVIRRITLDDLATYREIRLRALQDSPSAFGSTYGEESMRPDDVWRDRVMRCTDGAEFAVFLAYDADGCVGLAGGIVDDHLDTDRELISMWVAPSHRGTSVATE